MEWLGQATKVEDTARIFQGKSEVGITEMIYCIPLPTFSLCLPQLPHLVWKAERIIKGRVWPVFPIVFYLLVPGHPAIHLNFFPWFCNNPLIINYPFWLIVYKKKNEMAWVQILATMLTSWASWAVSKPFCVTMFFSIKRRNTSIELFWGLN